MARYNTTGRQPLYVKWKAGEKMEVMFNELSEHIRRKIRTGKPPDPNNSFALYVRLCRQKQNLSIAVLSNTIDLPLSTLYAIESGYITFEQMRQQDRLRLEQVLGVSYECFIKLNQHILEEITSMTDVNMQYSSSEDAEPAKSL